MNSLFLYEYTQSDHQNDNIIINLHTRIRLHKHKGGGWPLLLCFPDEGVTKYKLLAFSVTLICDDEGSHLAGSIDLL